ncbi:MAG: AAA family ATPase [Candidatus Heimdallarchaeota archaeon]|nr:MAG: AAA family ATPase [Candidatus Heimdallarchaeota archaeon]
MNNKKSVDIIRDAVFSSSIFKEGGEKTLNQSFIPNELKFREDNIRRISQNFRPLFLSESRGIEGFSTNIALTGPAGVGKTVTARYTVDHLQVMAERHHIKLYTDYKNCWTTRTKTSILRSFLRDQFGVASRGFSDEESTDILIRRLNSEQAYLVLILDEVSVLPQKDIRGFIHLPEEFGAEHRISIIMISRPTEWKVTLSSMVSQRIADVIQFQPYTLEETRNILDYRAHLAFKTTALSEDILEMVAEISDQTKNLRHGIEILYRTGRAADQQRLDELTPELVRRAKNDVFPELRADILEELKTHELFAALSIARRLHHKGITATTIEHSFKNYRIICEEWDLRPNAEAAFRNYLSTLEAIGILGKVTKGVKGRKGVRARLTIHDVPAAVLIERIEVFLSKRFQKS